MPKEETNSYENKFEEQRKLIKRALNGESVPGITVQTLDDFCAKTSSKIKIQTADEFFDEHAISEYSIYKNDKTGAYHLFKMKGSKTEEQIYDSIERAARLIMQEKTYVLATGQKKGYSAVEILDIFNSINKYKKS